MRTLAMLVAVVAVVGGGLYYVFRIHTPARDTSIAVAEIEAWETRANKMRECILGTAPASSIAAEALAIRELTNNPPELKKCTPSISDLSRQNAVDTGLKDVEDAWRSVNKATSALANTFAKIFIPGTNKQAAVDDLGDALDNLDVAHSNLRQAAGMEGEPNRPKPSLPEAELIMLGTAKRARLSAWLRPSAHGMIVLVEGIGRPAQQVVLVPGEAPKRVPFKPDVRPSITDPAWAVQTTEGAIGYGKLMADGSLDAPTAKPVGEPKATPQVLFALGNGTNGAISYLPDAARSTPQVALARIVGGAFEPGAPIEAEDYAFALDPPNRGLVAWSAKDKLHGVIVKPPTPPPPPAVGSGSGSAVVPAPPPPPKPVALGDGHTGLSCLTSTHGWIASDEKFVAFDETSAQAVTMPGHELIGCDTDNVLLRQAGHRYAVCGYDRMRPIPTNPEVPPSPECRVVDLTAGADALPALASGKVLAVGARQRVLAVWREKSEVKYYVLPSGLKPKLLHANDKILDVLGETDDGLAIARVKL